MTIKLGMEAKLYRNTGTYAAPMWVEMINVKDLTLKLEAIGVSVTAKPTYAANPPEWMTVP